MDRITPEDIGKDLPSGTIFVFGSNELGLHGAGAAKLAHEVYGARMGQGFGPMGQSFGIPTKDWEVKVLSLSMIEFYVSRFIAITNRSLTDKSKYYVTKIGCGLAGYNPTQIAPMFKSVRNQRNIWLPQDFLDIIDGNPCKSIELNGSDTINGRKA